MSDLEGFAEFLFGEQTGFTYSPVKRPTGDWIVNFFEWPVQKEAMFDWIRTEALESDVYLSPVIYSEKKAEKQYVKSSQVVWIEVDGNQNFNLNGIPEPSLVVQTSSQYNKHVYWRIPVSSPESVEDINERLTYFLEADSSGWNVNHVLRPPDTFNYKPGKNLPVFQASRSDAIYEPSAFDSAPRVERFVPLSLQEIPNPVEVIDRLPALLQLLVNRQMPVPPMDRSTFLMNAGHRLAEAGLEHAEIVACILHMDSRVKKFVGRHDALERINQLASIAFLKNQQRSAKADLVFYSPLEVLRAKRVLEWYMKGILPKRGFMFLTGPPSIGKSAFINEMMYCLATGEPFLGIPVEQELKILYYSVEMFWEEQDYFWNLQIPAWSNTEKWGENLQVTFDKDVGEEKIKLGVENFQPNLVVIDSLSEIIADAKEEEARRVTKFVQRIQDEHGTSFAFIHHNRKQDNTAAVKKPRSLSDLYGSYILAKSCQTVLSLWRDPGSAFLELDFLKGRFMDENVKQNTILVGRDGHLHHSIYKVTVNASKDAGRAGSAQSLLGNFGDADNSGHGNDVHESVSQTEIDGN